jgi:hypothetical protein
MQSRKENHSVKRTDSLNHLMKSISQQNSFR